MSLVGQMSNWKREAETVKQRKGTCTIHSRYDSSPRSRDPESVNVLLPHHIINHQTVHFFFPLILFLIHILRLFFHATKYQTYGHLFLIKHHFYPIHFFHLFSFLAFYFNKNLRNCIQLILNYLYPKKLLN